LAVAVHTTQFEIRDARHALLTPVLQLAAETVQQLDRASGRQSVLIAGVCGRTDQAVCEAELARGLGYHAGLLSLSAFPEADDATLLAHCRAVAERIPLVGFYLQPAVGGRVLSTDFWRAFASIGNVVAIKIAPFDRYKTLDVIRGVAESGRAEQIALYTGNDDTIVTDLLTEFDVSVGDRRVRLPIKGGLLGHWACWTRRAVELLERCKRARAEGSVPGELLTLAAQVTDCNAALFDAAGGFAGCIAGIQTVLHQQGLLSSPRCLSADEVLSPGQWEAIQRVRHAYPHLIDDDFVAQHRDQWLR
jgi:hypothetical protein